MSELCALCSGPPTGRYNERRACCRARRLRNELPGLRREALLERYRRVYGEEAAHAAAAALRGANGQRAAA